jgi:uncharacterized membrane protein YvbJ
MASSLVCPNCGKQQERNPDSLWCIECGAPLEGVTPIGASPDSDDEEQENAQVQPGAVVICPKCGSREESDPDSLFCDQCGTSLKGLTPISEAPEPAKSTDLDGLPSAGTCPDCGGQVVEIAEDRAVCRKCGEKLITVEARSRNRIGLAAALAAGGIMLWMLLRRHPGPF